MYHDFKKATHTTKLSIINSSVLYRVWDFGYHHPAVLFAQINEKDQLCVLRELQGTDIALGGFKTEVKAYTEEHFPKLKTKDVEISEQEKRRSYNHMRTKDFCDPAGADVNDVAGKSYVDILKAPPYKVIARIRRMKKLLAIEFIRQLLILRKDGLPGLLVDERYCPILVEGMEGGYHGKKNDPDTPADDGWYEHTQDCLQYLLANLYRKLGLLKMKTVSKAEKDESRTNQQSPIRRTSNTSNKYTGY